MQGVESNLNFLELAVWVKHKSDNEALTLFFIITWAFWGTRNKRVYENASFNPTSIIEKEISNHRLFDEVCRIPTKCTQWLGCWQPPPAHTLKLNVDGALFLDKKAAGIVAILRDCHGNLLMAASMKEELTQPETIESLAIVHGLQFCLQMGIKALIVEFDRRVLVAKVQNLQAFFSRGKSHTGH